jgi:hypothetical protein
MANRERDTDACTGVKRREEHSLESGGVENSDEIIHLVVDRRRLARR